ncbi:hypothetical protein Tco_0519482, partial [Tanacetum coccineum]
FNISGLKLELQRELWRSRPIILGEAFSLAHIAKARYEEERATIAIAKPNNLTAKVQVQDLEKLLKDEETSLIILCWLRLITCYTLLLWRLCIKSSLHMGLVTPAEEVVDSRHNSTFSSLVEHESLQVLQLWEIIGIDDVHELMDNMGIYNFVQQNAGERMHLQAIVTGHPYQGVGGSPEEASWEWISDSHMASAANVRRRKRLKCYIQGSGRREKKNRVDHESERRGCALFGASVFAFLNLGPGSFPHRRIWDHGIKIFCLEITLSTR